MCIHSHTHCRRGNFCRNLSCTGYFVSGEVRRHIADGMGDRYMLIEARGPWRVGVRRTADGSEGDICDRSEWYMLIGVRGTC